MKPTNQGAELVERWQLAIDRLSDARGRGFDACKRCPEAAGIRLKDMGVDIQ